MVAERRNESVTDEPARQTRCRNSGRVGRFEVYQSGTLSGVYVAAHKFPNLNRHVIHTNLKARRAF